MGLLLPVLVAAVSLLILPGWSFYFDVTPRIVLLLAGAAAVLAWADSWRVPATARGKMFLALLGFEAIAIALATAFSTNRTRSLVGSAWRRDGLPVEIAVLVVAAAVMVSLVSDPSRLRIFLRITVLGSLPASLYGIAQYFGIDPWIPAAGYRFGEGKFMIVRPPATLGHAAYFATFLLYAVFAGFALAKLESSRASKMAAMAAAGVAAVAMVLSGTRASMVGTLAGALFVLLRERSSRRQWRAMALGAAAALAFLAVFYASPAGARLRARVHWSADDRLGGARLLLWRDSLRMAESRWATGYGPETFSVDFPPHESVELARAYPDFYHESPHNIFLDALVSKGIVGLAALAAMAGFGLMYARGAMGGAFVAMLVSQQFTTFTVPTELYFYVSLAILAAGGVETAVSRAVPRVVLRWAMAAPLACLAIYFATGDAMLGGARRALDRGDAAGAAKMADRARAWHASADIYFSRRFLGVAANDPVLRLRTWGYALEAARNAPATADDPMNAYVNLASFYAGAGDTADVEKNLRAAIAAAPEWFKPHWLLARVLVLEGRRAEAEAQARAAAERNVKDPEVGQLVEQLSRR